MTLWLRRRGLVSPADADRADYLVIEHDKVIGRIYEQRYVPRERAMVLLNHSGFHIDPAFETTTNGCLPTLDEAKAGFREFGSKAREATKQKEQQQL